MLKIQGSTRSSHIPEGVKHKRLPDTKLVWSLEENSQQETGLPREFTFVFLVERPSKAESKKQRSRLSRHVSEGNVRSSRAQDAASTQAPGVEQMAMIESNAHRDADIEAHVDHETTFGPFSIGITVMPRISGMTMNKVFVSEAHQEVLLDEEVGQKFLVEHTIDSKKDGLSSVEGYYNFANMKQDFEGLIELPGNAVTTTEPELPHS